MEAATKTAGVAVAVAVATVTAKFRHQYTYVVELETGIEKRFQSTGVQTNPFIALFEWVLFLVSIRNTIDWQVFVSGLKQESDVGTMRICVRIECVWVCV